ncbi:ester cyclase [Stackebrandtia nassauensis]|uniref:Ester cyclase n=1 Tax=Stackebrandtia nassauensis (strain DSM 44728 / CIP 108903 / NRRL B-16338 / NBRC 102104 / LLR-40K-21) TaxID=446470 RepID=D3PX64_STANL|nr:ester cyclase [Stackebrandtia nassauensis]ADD41327.1 protein of unknown function DUF1486 [Stackebrandtia nassauensis DSM 44728]
MTTTSAAHNKETYRRFHDALNGAADAPLIQKLIDDFVDPDLKLHTPLPLKSTGADSIKEVFQTLRRAYPDLHVAIEDLIAEDDKVVSRNTVTGTHLGEYLGMAPTGNTVTYKEIFVFRFADGRITEAWGVVDVLSQLRQLGAMPGGIPGGS